MAEQDSDREARIAETVAELRAATDALAERLDRGEIIPGVNG
jgi:hypothetical protein